VALTITVLAMEMVVSSFLAIGMMVAVVVIFRAFVRRPAGVWQEDPPGVRTMVVFRGNHPDFFEDDPPEGPYVGVRLFGELCDGLADQGVAVENRGTIQNAQRAECVLEGQRFALVLEWLEHRWLASVEWVPRRGAERRHLALTHRVYAPADSPALRRLLRAIDQWLRRDERLFDVKWHRKEKWIAGDQSTAAARPVDDPRDG